MREKSKIKEEKINLQKKLVDHPILTQKQKKSPKTRYDVKKYKSCKISLWKLLQATSDVYGS